MKKEKKGVYMSILTAFISDNQGAGLLHRHPPHGGERPVVDPTHVVHLHHAVT